MIPSLDGQNHTTDMPFKTVQINGCAPTESGSSLLGCETNEDEKEERKTIPGKLIHLFLLKMSSVFQLKTFYMAASKAFSSHALIIKFTKKGVEMPTNKKNILPNADGLAGQIDVIRCVITAELSISFFSRQNGFFNCK